MSAFLTYLVIAFCGGGVLTILPVTLSGQGHKIGRALRGRGGRL